MSSEDTYIKDESTSGAVERALVVQMGEGFTKIEDNPSLLEEFKEIGLAPDEFRVLVSGNFNDAIEAHEGQSSFNGITEKFHVRVAQIGDKQIEIAHCSRDKDSVEPPSGFDLQLRQSDSAYKILVGLKGEGVLSFPKTAQPAGTSGMYITSSDTDKIPFHRGTIAIINAPTAWSFDSSKKGLEYLYISFPRHSHLADVVTEVS